VLIEQLEQLSEDGASSHSELGGFSKNAMSCCQRCKKKLAEMQVAAPNTMRICHTVVAFNVVVADFSQRVAAYLDQGFFAQDLADSAIHIVHGRQRELKRFFAFNPVVRLILSPFPRSGVVFQAYEADGAVPRAAVVAGNNHARNGGHPNGQASTSEEPAVVQTANPAAVNFLHERRAMAAENEDDPGEHLEPAAKSAQLPPTAAMQQSAHPAVQMLRERQQQPQMRSAGQGDDVEMVEDI